MLHDKAFSSMPAASESISTLVAKAQAFKNSDRINNAIAAWKAIVAQDPDTLTYQHDLAAALGDAGRNQEAADVISVAIKRGLDHPESHLVHARACAGIHDHDRAQKAYLKVLSKRPDDAIAHRELAQLRWMRTGDVVKAEEALNNAIRHHPDLISLQILKAEIKGQTGDPDAQYDFLKALIKSTGHHPQICHFAARAALACKDFPAALELATLAREKIQDQSDVTAVYITALLAMGDAKTALRVIESLRQHDPNNQYFIALQATAWRLCKDERYESLFDYKRMVLCAPLDTPTGWTTRDEYLNDLGQELTQAHCYLEHPFFLSVRHGSQISSITKFDKPAMSAFAIAAHGPLQQYMEQLSPGYDPLRSRFTGTYELIDAWSVLLPKNGFHISHVHPAGWLSSACHIHPPAEDPENPKAGWLKFGEPGCATSPPLAAEHFVKPKAGHMVIFPSYMWHGTEPFSKGEARLTVAADFAPSTNKT